MHQIIIGILDISLFYLAPRKVDRVLECDGRDREAGLRRLYWVISAEITDDCLAHSYAYS